MDERLAAAKREGFGPDSPGWDPFDQGSSIAWTADRLGESKDFESARLLLYRSAVALLARARLARAGHAPSAASVEDQASEPAADSSDQPRSGNDRAGTRAEENGDGTPSGAPKAEFDLGCRAVSAAERLKESGGFESSSELLYRCAGVLFARAQVADPGSELQPPALNTQDWNQLVELSSAAQEVTKLPPDQQSLVTACLQPGGESHLATLARNEHRIAVRQLAHLSRGLTAELQAEGKIIRRVIARRWLRIGIGAALPVALIAGGLTQCGTSNEHNLALQRPVTVSSKLPVDIGRDPSLLVDGDTHNLGFHTAEAPNQHVTIDLGQPQRVHRVVVYNRADCCKDRAVPLRIEVSQDGRSYQKVAQRDEVFDVWEATFAAVDARYVRLFRPKKACFHLAEVEVY